MIPEIGHFLLITAFAVAIIQGILPLWGGASGNLQLMAIGRSAAFTQLLLLVMSFACLVFAFLTNDFTVAYVATNSNSYLPYWYKVSAVWGGHEGSLLLWVLILAAWGGAVAFFGSHLPAALLARVLAVMGWLGVGFTSFILFTSNPFLRLLPDFPLDGNDLNPLLQDIGLIFHPPMLYMGYVGFSVPFAFVIAGLIGGQLDSVWARWSRPWATVAWCFLTLGIALGSWWAYYELGWGGWWFWDPVENASFMPWLAGTALLHSLAVTDKRAGIKVWTVLLAILTFSLSLLGTFLVRSGVLTSVHAFATDPARGAFILGFLVIVIGGSLLLFALRAHRLKSYIEYSLVSRESWLIFQNILMSVAALVVLLGTLYPLLSEAFGAGKLSVGPPYFNLLFQPLAFLALLLMAVAPYIQWRSYRFQPAHRGLYLVAGASVFLGVLMPWLYFGYVTWQVALAFALSLWVVLSTLKNMFSKIVRAGLASDNLAETKIPKRPSLSRSYLAMVFAHIGFAVSITGIAFTSEYSLERDVRMYPGDTLAAGPYQFEFKGVSTKVGANYSAVVGSIDVQRNGKQLTQLRPEKRTYRVQKSSMTEAAIDGGLFRDLYVALGEPLGDESWAVRIYYKPFVRWVWLGAVFMALGGAFALSDRRYRRIQSRQNKVSSMVSLRQVSTVEQSAKPL